MIRLQEPLSVRVNHNIDPEHGSLPQIILCKFSWVKPSSLELRSAFNHLGNKV